MYLKLDVPLFFLPTRRTSQPTADVTYKNIVQQQHVTGLATLKVSGCTQRVFLVPATELYCLRLHWWQYHRISNITGERQRHFAFDH
jgi:hypothetical protein